MRATDSIPTRLASRQRGFTLTELMVAIAVLVGVLLASSKIFSTTSTVTRTGKAVADVLQEAAAIESRMRADLARLSHDGVFAIRCVEVQNDVNGAVLLNPNLAPTEVIRADQMVFFANGVESAQTFRIGEGALHKAQGIASRVYYGHAYQLGEAGEAFRTPNFAFDALNVNTPDEVVYPWTSGQIATVRTNYEYGLAIFNSTSQSTTDVLAPDARRWLLVRQPVLLVDDDRYAVPRDAFSKSVYLNQVISARSIFLDDPDLGRSPQVYHGRVDAAATELGDIRLAIVRDESINDWRTWEEQYDLIAEELLYYPRAERTAPSMHRVDQALTNNVISSACSSVRIEWTWENDVGAFPGFADIPNWLGFMVDFSNTARGNGRPQPWFGLSEPKRSVAPYGDDDHRDAFDYERAETIFADNIERLDMPFTGVLTYEAVFGYNQERPFGFNGQPDEDLGYTPWPSAIRVTLTLHDPATTLEGGRDIQFVIDLPRPPGRP